MSVFVMGADANLSDFHSNYTKLSYIQSSGIQYINTGFCPKGNTRVVIDCDLISGTFPVAFATRTDSNVGAFGVISLDATSLRQYYGTVETDAKVNILGRHILDMNGSKVSVDEKQALSVATQSFTSANPLYLLAYYGLETHTSFATTAKLYSCQIYDNGILIRDYVPCMNRSGEVGLYDLATEQFYGNAGTGAFVGG